MSSSIRIFLLYVSAIALLFTACAEQPDYTGVPPYKNPTLPVSQRVDDLVGRMTLEQKVSQMLSDAPAIPELDVPAYNWWNECLHGVARSGKATVFPQAIGLAATWDTPHMLKIATAISDEARAKYHHYLSLDKHGIYQGLTFWSPNINIFRDPRWGRGMETYGEDPYLTGRLAVNFVRGLQGSHPKYLKTVATVKHYAVHSGPEPERHTFDARANERDLLDFYLPHFRTAIMESGAWSVMCAYNRYMGDACCSSDRLLNDILRQEWGFDGYVVSDCGAIYDIWGRHNIVNTAPEAAALAVKAGTDLNCGDQYLQLVQAVQQELITEEEIDRAVKRLFTARMKLGMFDPDDQVPYSKIPYDIVDCRAHRRLALLTARKSMVLLKNDAQTLPFAKDIGKVAVIGPNADDVEVLLGNYNGYPSQPITPLQGIRKKIGKDNVLYAMGCEWAPGIPALQVIPDSVLFTTNAKGERVHGLTGAYYNNQNQKGDPVFTRIDKQIDFDWWDGTPSDDLQDDNFSIRWTGEIVAPVSGDYALGAEGFNAFRLFINDEELISFGNVHHPNKQFETIEMIKGETYRVTLEFSDYHNNALIKLLWSPPGQDHTYDAIEAAKQADAIVLCMGLSPRLEGEEMRVKVDGFNGGDRLTLDLPQIQLELMQTLHTLGKPMVLVLMSGSAVAVNWANENIPAIVQAWYPGQAAGRAIADVLFGDYNPGGRLPVTFYKSVDQLPPFTEYNLVNQTYRYFDGIPLYPFGHGMSYTTFRYHNLRVPEMINSGSPVEVSIDVENTGQMTGDEVVQLYITDVKASVPVPIRTLQGFQRITLKPGESRTVSFTLDPRQLSVIDKSYQRVQEPGLFTVSVGGKQPDVSGPHTTDVITSQFEVTGSAYYLE